MMVDLVEIKLEDTILPQKLSSLPDVQRKSIKSLRGDLRNYDAAMDDFEDGKRKDRPKCPLPRPHVYQTKSGGYKPADDESMEILLALDLEKFETYRGHVVPSPKVVSPDAPKPKATKSIRHSSSEKTVRKSETKTAVPSERKTPTSHPVSTKNTSADKTSKNRPPQDGEFVEVLDWEVFNTLPPTTRKARLMHIIATACDGFAEPDRRQFLVALMRFLGEQGVIVTPEELYSSDYAKKLKPAW